MLAHTIQSGKKSLYNLHVQKHSLLFATLVALFLALTRDNLAQHDNTITIHESNTGEAFAIFERIANKWLLWLETALRHFVRFQRVWAFHFLTICLLAE